MLLFSRLIDIVSILIMIRSIHNFKIIFMYDITISNRYKHFEFGTIFLGVSNLASIFYPWRIQKALFFLAKSRCFCFIEYISEFLTEKALYFTQLVFFCPNLLPTFKKKLTVETSTSAIFFWIAYIFPLKENLQFPILNVHAQLFFGKVTDDFPPYQCSSHFPNSFSSISPGISSNFISKWSSPNTSQPISLRNGENNT